jgi:hypothetical protein
MARSNQAAAVARAYGQRLVAKRDTGMAPAMRRGRKAPKLSSIQPLRKKRY